MNFCHCIVRCWRSAFAHNTKSCTTLPQYSGTQTDPAFLLGTSKIHWISPSSPDIYWHQTFTGGIFLDYYILSWILSVQYQKSRVQLAHAQGSTGQFTTIFRSCSRHSDGGAGSEMRFSVFYWRFSAQTNSVRIVQKDLSLSFFLSGPWTK